MSHDGKGFGGGEKEGVMDQELKQYLEAMEARIDAKFAKCATKEDLERFATKEDLERLETKLLTAF